MKNIFALPILLTALLGTHAQAQESESGTSRGRAIIETSRNTIQRGYAGYLGAGAGYSTYNSNLNVEGAPTSLKLLGSYVTETGLGVFDIGYGVQSQTFSQDEAINKDITTGVLELAARYQYENRWQLGGVYNQIFNRGLNYSANQADVEFVGVQLLKEFSFSGNYLGRAGGRILTSINVNKESVNMIVLDFQIGWGGANRISSTASAY